MASSDSSSAAVETGGLRLLGVAIAFGLVGSSALLRSTAVASPTTAFGGLAILTGLGVFRLWRRSPTPEETDENRSEESDHGRTDDRAGDPSEPDCDDGDSSVWNAIPRWQYGGRHVESGGLARGEQEEALADVKQQAEELSDDPYRK
ncbi:hypothetical protein [Natrarchaeobius chitinivorans]|uniref:Uncharacterized protein n=1 Tax=Natrarchaeobius chitinivorans TaxID=1679083 RepID=A0A3N6LY74_NATCH|nr:hypothetical protein [Natrarchaeobius chitinivorans]RQG94007.1 hypothetical protein EA473_13085 [Natrarchaeobius chitinivorans]